MGLSFKTKTDQSGYDALGQYIRAFWRKNNNYQSTVICDFDISYDATHWENHIEVVNPCGFDSVEFSYDWWEGQPHICLNGLCYLEEIKVPPLLDFFEKI